jgi:antirestriction protein
VSKPNLPASQSSRAWVRGKSWAGENGTSWNNVLNVPTSPFALPFALSPLSLEDLQEAVQAMLSNSPTLGSEEHAIHDFEGFGSYRMHEYDDLADVVALANLIVERGEELASAVWDHADGDDSLARELIEDSYQGCFEDLETWAEGFLKDSGELDRVPEHFDAVQSPLRFPGGGRTWTLPPTPGTWSFQARYSPSRLPMVFMSSGAAEAPFRQDESSTSALLSRTGCLGRCFGTWSSVWCWLGMNGLELGPARRSYHLPPLPAGADSPGGELLQQLGNALIGLVEEVGK